MRFRAPFLVAVLGVAVSHCKVQPAADSATLKDDTPTSDASTDADKALEDIVAQAAQSPEGLAHQASCDFAADPSCNEGTDTSGATALKLNDDDVANDDLPVDDDAFIAAIEQGLGITPNTSLGLDDAEGGRDPLAIGVGLAILDDAVTTMESSINDTKSQITAQGGDPNSTSTDTGSSTATNSNNTAGQNTGSGSGSGTDTSGGGGSSLDPNANATPVLALAGDTSTGTQTVAQLQAKLKKLQDQLTRVKAALAQAQAKNKVFPVVKGQKSQWHCVVHGAVMKNNSCQCRGWGMDVDSHSFTPPDGDLKSFIVANKDRKCPVLETQYCSGWDTRNGGCGIFGKGVGWGVPAIAFSPKSNGDTNQCYHTYDKILSDATLRAKVFGAPGNCDGKLALKNGGIIEVWSYDKNTGRPTGKLSSTTATTDNSRATNSDTTTTTTTTTTPAVATDAASFKTLCEAQKSGSKKGSWDFNMAGGGGCNCGGFSISTTVYVTNYSDADRQVFPQACQQSLGR